MAVRQSEQEAEWSRLQSHAENKASEVRWAMPPQVVVSRAGHSGLPHLVSTETHDTIINILTSKSYLWNIWIKEYASPEI